MTEQHPITPPPELVEQWYDVARGPRCEQELATQAARWGSDKELEVCLEWLFLNGWSAAVKSLRDARWGLDKELEVCLEWLFLNGWSAAVKSLRDARRPKPASLAEIATVALDTIEDDYLAETPLSSSDLRAIRSALERLQELEKLSDDQG